MNYRNGIAAFCGAFVLTLLLASGAYAGTEGNLKKKSQTDTISVPEMQCGMCEMKISKTLKKLEGVSSVSADAEADEVVVTYDPEVVSREDIENTIAGAGYDAGEAKTTTAAQAKLHACCRPGSHE